MYSSHERPTGIYPVAAHNLDIGRRHSPEGVGRSAFATSP